jgi:hypothetical protein
MLTLVKKAKIFLFQDRPNLLRERQKSGELDVDPGVSEANQSAYFAIALSIQKCSRERQ